MEKFINVSIVSMFTSSVLLLTVPAVVVAYTEMPFFYFVLCNTVGIILATLFIIVAAGLRLAIARVGGDVTEFSRRNTLMSKILFAIVLVAQLVNLMFVNAS